VKLLRRRAAAAATGKRPPLAGGRLIARERHSAPDLRETILAAAEELFVEGYAGFSMRKLADRIGYSATTIYLYFKDQDDLFSQLMEENFRRLMEAFRHLDAVDDPVEKLKALGRTYVRFGLENPHHYRLLFMIRPDIDAKRPPPGRLAQLAWQALQKAVEDVLAQAKHPALDPEVASYAFWCSLHGLVSLRILPGKEIAPGKTPEIESYLIDRLVSGLVA
jgi:AcrR family transcriptional regulator